MTAISLITAASVRSLGLRPAEARAAAQAILKSDRSAKAGDSRRSGGPGATAETAGSISRSAVEAKKEAISRAKTQAREKVERIREELKLIKKIWASNPKEMTKQLARIAKELASAAKEYAKAAKEAGETVQAPAAPAVAPPVSATPEQNSDAGMVAGEGEAKGAGAEEGSETKEPRDEAGRLPEPLPPATRTEAVAAYTTQAAAQARQDEKAVRDQKQSLALDDQDFARLMKGLARKVRELLQETKIKSTFTLKQPLEKSEDYKDADETLKALEKAMDEMETEANAVLNDPVAHAERIAMLRSA